MSSSLSENSFDSRASQQHSKFYEQVLAAANMISKPIKLQMSHMGGKLQHVMDYSLIDSPI